VDDLIEEGFFLTFSDPSGSSMMVVIEEDEKTCYAYLLEGEEIVGNVWLYNRREASVTPEWELPNAKQYIPFSNPRSHINHEGPAVSTSDHVCVYWNGNVAAVYLNGKNLHAILHRGDFPGKCIYAAAAGPLAKPYESPRASSEEFGCGWEDLESFRTNLDFED
jgi:hypothetical protein